MSLSQPRYRVIPPSAYTPEIGSFVAMLEHCRESVLDSVKDLTVAQLDHQQDDKANPIGALLAHMAAIEWFYVVASFEGVQPQPHDWGEWSVFLRLTPATWAAAKGQSIENHVERLARIRVRALAALEKRDDAWLSGTFSLPWTQELANHRWALYHLLEDELNHRGQIRWLKGRLP
ncbi:MAG: DinB family protein [Gemmatimonas sp.]